MNLSADKLLQNEYQTRLNKAIDYIYKHYNEDLNLSGLAQIACFSKFHFHRLFHAMVGETVNDFIRRVRLEKSVPKLTGCPSKSITEIALECGFSCSQNYSKAFKALYGVTPTVVRREFGWDELKTKMNNLKVKKESDLSPAEVFIQSTYQDKCNLLFDDIFDEQQSIQIHIGKIPDLQVAYIRNRGPYDLDAANSAFQHLKQWAESRELIDNGSLFLSIMWNLTSITPYDKLIHDYCITVPESVKSDKWMNIQTVPGGKFAIQHCEVETGHMQEAWTRFALRFLMSSDYHLADRPFYQFWPDNPEVKSLKYQTIDLYLPIKSLYE